MENNIELKSKVAVLNGFTDKTWMKDNLLCMISNAVKFTKEGTKISIEMDRIQKSSSSNAISINHSNSNSNSNITNSNNGNNDEKGERGIEIEIRVIDNGSFIPDIDRLKFFEQPSQRERKEGGLGIGLFVLSNRIKALKGKLRTD